MSAVGEPRSFNDLESVLIAAADEFLLRGYDAARIGHIAAAAGLSKSSLYHHVEGKEQLLALGIDRALAGLERCFAEARRLPDPAESVRRLIELVIEDMTDRARLPFVALLIGVRGNSELERRALDERRRYDRELAALLERGQAGGAIRVDVPADVLARLCFGTINSLHSWVRPDHPDVVSIRAAATAYVLAGITATR
ncbi:MAG: TetR/AcrR family transcriptional regulator [Actinomycetota bacterium]